MAGRGGRAAALLQALQEQPRKPGPDVDVKHETSSPQMFLGRGTLLSKIWPPQVLPSANDTIPTSSAAATKPLGRAALLTQAFPTDHGDSVENVKPEVLVDGLVSPHSIVTATAEQFGSPAGDMANLHIKEEPRLTSSPVFKGQKGFQGISVPMTANYIRMRSKNACWCQYQVTYNPNIDSRNMRFKLLLEHEDVIGKARVFDGTILFLPIELPRKDTCFKSVRVTDGKEVDVRVSLTKTLSPGSADCLHAYNVLFKRIQNALKLVQVGRHCYDPLAAIAVPQHRLQIWPGYITAVKEHEDGLMLLCDVSHRVLRCETVLDIMGAIIQSTKASGGYREAIIKAVVGNTVLTRYNNKTYRVDDIAWDQCPEKTFDKGGVEMSFREYYKKSYNIDIMDSKQPLLISRPKKKEQINGSATDGATELICLVPELSYMTGLTDEMRQDFKVMKDLAVHTRVTPAQRMHALKKFVDNVNSTPDAKRQLSEWGLELDRSTVQMQGRTFDPEIIQFKGGQTSAGPTASWLRGVMENSVVSAVSLTNWMLVHTARDSSKATDFVNCYRRCAPAMGIDVTNPLMVTLSDDRTETYLRNIKERLTPQIQCVVVIFPSSRDDRYNALKKMLCIQCPVPSQVMLSRTLAQQQKLKAVVQRVALQINVKLGGELWAVAIPLKSIMIVGIDVYHEKASGSQSVAALVASVNTMVTRYYSRVCIQMPGEELVGGLKICFLAALRKFHSVNHALPEKIVVFRDGVGDGMLPVVGDYEVKQLAECFASFGESYQPRMAVVVVQKRINTRLFLKKGGNGNVLCENPPPGTIIDHTITRKNWYDFFLVSQHVTQGTVTPTHYVVVHDDSGMKPDHMQKLAYKMCHVYYNWPGTIRVPAQCQYAHKLAYFVGQNLRKEASHELDDRLYYL